MADKKISELPVATAPTGTELMEVVQGGVNKQLTAQDIADLGGGGGTSIPYGTTSGTNTYTITATPTVTAYADGDLYLIEIGTSSTNASTLNFDSVGALKVYERPNKQITAGDFEEGMHYLVQHDSALDGGTGGFIVVGDLNHERLTYRGGYDVSSNLFPSTGGSGPSGGLRTGDFWVAANTGTLGSTAVSNRDMIINIDGSSPGQTAGNWAIISGVASVDTKLALKANLANSKVLVIACSDEVTPITAATNKVKFRMPYAMTVSAVRASLSTTQTSGSIFTVDINESGTTILSTKLTIDNGETTSTTAATPAVISDTALADDAEITIDVDQIGDNTAKGLKVTLIGS
jgi:hypothetical protein